MCSGLSSELDSALCKKMAIDWWNKRQIHGKEFQNYLTKVTFFALKCCHTRVAKTIQNIYLNETKTGCMHAFILEEPIHNYKIP